MAEHDQEPGGDSREARDQQADDYRQVKLDKLAALRAAGCDPFHEVRYDRTHSAAEVEASFDTLEGQEVAVAGRLMAKRLHGKAGFGDVMDESGRIQVYFKRDVLGEEALERAKELDLGDLIGVCGKAFKTRTGQVTVEAAEVTLLAKILKTLPEKWHGLTDVEQRYRQRYVDLIMNREVMERLRLRSEAVSEIRRFLDARGFLEVETPMLHAICGGGTAEPFVTHWNVLKADYYLRIAIELHLKRLIVGGFEKVYEIGRTFRNEGVSTRHNPEFTMLELYWAYVDYHDIMQLTEDLTRHLASEVFKREQVEFGDHTVDFSRPFAKMTFDEALRKWAGCGLGDLRTLEDVQREAKRLGIELPEERGFGHCLDEIFKERVEPQLIQPTFIIDYPAALSPLAKRHADNPDLTYRFELFMAGFEVANSFSELNDPLDQRERLERQIADKAEGISEVDEDFLTALEYGMPPTGGLGIGIDRLIMVLSGTTAIREVILFPQLRQK